MFLLAIMSGLQVHWGVQTQVWHSESLREGHWKYNIHSTKASGKHPHGSQNLKAVVKGFALVLCNQITHLPHQGSYFHRNPSVLVGLRYCNQSSLHGHSASIHILKHKHLFETKIYHSHICNDIDTDMYAGFWQNFAPQTAISYSEI